MWHRIIALGRSEGLRSTTITTFGNVASTILGAIAIVLASRLVSPHEFGIFSAVFAVMLMLSKIGDLGSNVALQRELSQPSIITTSKKKIELASYGLYIKLVLSILGFVGSLVFSFWLTNKLNLNSTSYLLAGSLAMIGIIFFDYFAILAQTSSKFGVYIFGNSLQSGLKIISILALSLFGELNALSLILIYGFAPLLASAFILKLLGFVPQTISLQKLKKITTYLLPVIKWTFISVLAASLSDNIDILIIQSYISSEQTGFFSAGFRIASFFSVVGYSLGIVLNVRVAKYKSKDHLRSYLKKASFIAIFSLAAAYFLAEFSYYYLLYSTGSSYLQATEVLKLLFYSTGITIATTPFVSIFYSLSRPSYFALSGIIMAITLILADYFLIPGLGIIGAGYARIISRLAVFVFTVLFVYSTYRRSYAR